MRVGGTGMEKMIRIIDNITKFFGAVAGLFIILGITLVITEVLVRTLFNGSIYISVEYSAYFMVAISFFGLAYTLREKEHIRIVFLNNFIKGNKSRLFMDLYSYTVGLTVFCFITVASIKLFWNSLLTGTQSIQLTKTYLAIPQFIIPLGSLIIVLQFVAEILRSIVNYRKGRIDGKGTESQMLGR